MSRGYYGIGVERLVHGVNLGTLWRSAFCLGASFVFTIGARYKKQSSDCLHTTRHIPYFRFETWEDFKDHIPHDCRPIGVEITKYAEPLAEFSHPRSAVYILGPEDGCLSPQGLEVCWAVVKIPSRFCLNVATAGAIVMYDRQIKNGVQWDYGKPDLAYAG